MTVIDEMCFPVVESQDLAGQAAFLPTKILQPMEVNSALEITLCGPVKNEAVTCLVLAYPQEKEKESFCEISTAVTSETFDSDAVTINDFKITSFRKLEVTPSSRVEVEVICETVTACLKLRNLRRDRLTKALKLVLEGLVVKPGSMVKLKNDPVMKTYNIKAIIVKGVSSESLQDEKSKSCGIDEAFRIHDQTSVSVQRIVSFHRRISEGAKSLPEFDKLGGMGVQISQLEKIIGSVGKRKNSMSSFLLTGPPGCGKSQLIQKVFRGHGFLLCIANCCDLVRSDLGTTEKLLKSLFNKAKMHLSEGPTLLVFEEIDLLAPTKSVASANQVRIVSQLASLLDTHSQSGLVIGATTSDISRIESSLRRPGRFTHEIFIPVPSLEERLQMIDARTSGETKPLEISAEKIAQVTPGYVASDLAALCQRLSSSSIGNSEAVLKSALRSVPPSGFKQGSCAGTVNVKDTGWDEIGGLQGVKRELQSVLLWPSKFPQHYRTLGLQRPTGVMLYGPPGCGKTSIVKAVASMVGATFFYVSSANIFSPYVGDSEKALSEVFRKARMAAPSIVFIDEIEALVSTRFGGGGGAASSGVQERVLSVLLNEMDGVGVRIDHGDSTKEKSTLSNSLGVMLIGATNRPDMLDPALCRPGRLGKHVYVPPPNSEERLAVLKTCVGQTPLSDDVDFQVLAGKTSLFSGADLSNLCKEAALHAMTARGGCGPVSGQVDQENDLCVKMSDFYQCLEWMRPSLTEEMIQDYSKFQ